MCIPTKDGYIMKDGTDISFHTVNIGEIAPKHIQELSEASASLLDVLAIRNSHHNLREDLNNIKNEILTALEKHTISCGINGIPQLIDKKIREYPETVAAEREKGAKRIGIYLALIISVISIITSTAIFIKLFWK